MVAAVFFLGRGGGGGGGYPMGQRGMGGGGGAEQGIGKRRGTLTGVRVGLRQTLTLTSTLRLSTV